MQWASKVGVQWKYNTWLIMGGEWGTVGVQGGGGGKAEGHNETTVWIRWRYSRSAMGYNGSTLEPR